MLSAEKARQRDKAYYGHKRKSLKELVLSQQSPVQTDQCVKSQ